MDQIHNHIVIVKNNNEEKSFWQSPYGQESPQTCSNLWWSIVSMGISVLRLHWRKQETLSYTLTRSSAEQYSIFRCTEFLFFSDNQMHRDWHQMIIAKCKLPHDWSHPLARFIIEKLCSLSHYLFADLCAQTNQHGQSSLAHTHKKKLQ